MPRPFLLLSSRPEEETAAGEHAAVARHLGVAPDAVVQVRTEQKSFLPVDLEAFRGVLLGGSPYGVTDASKGPVQRRVEAEVTSIVGEIVRRDLPFLGLCYGVGILAAHLGSSVDHRHAEPVGGARITLTPEGRRDPLLRGTPAEFAAYVGHKEACPVTPRGAVLLATSATCPVQMFRVGRRVYATQFHPELDLTGLTVRIRVYRTHGYFPPDEAHAVLARAGAWDVSAAHTMLRRFAEICPAG